MSAIVGTRTIGVGVKFRLLVELGDIRVLSYYVHERQMARFLGMYGKNMYSYHNAITDANFPNPSHVLKPGDKLQVSAFALSVGYMATSEECLDFLAIQQKAVLVGAQGLSLVFERKRHQLPRGYLYASFDHKERLWKRTSGGPKVPDLGVYEDGGFDIGFAPWGGGWGWQNAILCFKIG